MTFARGLVVVLLACGDRGAGQALKADPREHRARVGIDIPSAMLSDLDPTSATGRVAIGQGRAPLPVERPDVVPP